MVCETLEDWQSLLEIYEGLCHLYFLEDELFICRNVLDRHVRKLKGEKIGEPEQDKFTRRTVYAKSMI